jgi:hypothetical protein
LCIYEIQNIILGTTILWIFDWLEHQGMAKKTFKDVAGAANLKAFLPHRAYCI